MQKSSIARIEGLESRRLLSAGSLDPSFGNAGNATVSFTQGSATKPRTLLRRTDGSLAVVGDLYSGGSGGGVIASFTPAGQLDAQFASNPLPLWGGQPQVAAVQADGKIVVVGVQQNTSRDLFVYRLNTDGTIDMSFNAVGQKVIDIGSGTDDMPAGVAIQHDGGIVITGICTPVGNPSPSAAKTFLLKLMPGGPRDLTFGQGGLITMPIMVFSNPLAIDANNNILIEGTLLNQGQAQNVTVLRLDAEGQPDMSFNLGSPFITGDSANEQPGAFTILPSGKILTAFLSNGSDEKFLLLNGNGAPDSTYGNQGVVPLSSNGDQITSLGVDSGGRVIAGFGLNATAKVERFLSDAKTLDSAFGTNGAVTIDNNGAAAGSVAVVPADNSIFYLHSTGSDFIVTRLLGDTATANPPPNNPPPNNPPPNNPPSGTDPNNQTNPPPGTDPNNQTNPPPGTDPNNQTNPPPGTDPNNQTNPPPGSDPNNPPSTDPNNPPPDSGGLQQPPNNVTVDPNNPNNPPADPNNGSQNPPPTSTPNIVANFPGPMSPLIVGGTAQVGVFVSYSGTTAASVDANIYLSSDSIGGNADDIFIGHFNAVQVSPKTMGQNVGTASVQIPASLPSGNYYLVEVVDTANVVAEAREDDNTSVTQSPFPIGLMDNGKKDPKGKEVGFDLANLKLNPTSVVAGKSGSFSADLVNNTGAALGERQYNIYLSPGPTFNQSDILIGTITLPAQDNGTTIPFSATLAIPANVRPATYFLSGIPVDLALSGGDTGGTTKTPLLTVTPAPLKPGSLNSNFGTGGVAQNKVQAKFTAVDSVLDSSGRIVVAGTQTGVAGTQNGSAFVLLRFNADGSQDTTFGVGGLEQIMISPDDRASAITIDASGKFLIAGTSQGNFTILRFNPDGSPDQTFGDNGHVMTDLAPMLGVPGSRDVAKEIAVRGDGKIYVVGSTDARDAGDFAVVRYNANGTIDGSFGSGGVSVADFGHSVDSANTIAIQKDGNVVIAGSATVNGVVQIAAVRMLNNGALDTKFGTAGRVTFTGLGNDNEVNAIRIQSDGKIVLGGFVAAGTPSDGTLTTSLYLARLDTTGKLDAKFGSAGQVKTSLPNVALASIDNLVVTPEGKIVVAGKTAATLADAAAGNVGVAVTRYTATGQLDTTFNKVGYLLLFQPTSVANAASAASPLLAAASSDLNSAFSSFSAAAAGLVNLTPSGGILALATSTDTSSTSSDSSDSSSSGSTTVSIASIVADGADLVSSLSSSKIPSSVITGASGQVTLTVTNSGSLSIKGSVPLTLYLSASSVHSTGDYKLLSTKLSVNLAAGKSAKFVLQFTFPKNAANGDYFILADLNPTGSVSELSTTNDDSSSSTTTEVAKPFVNLAISYVKSPAGRVAPGRVTPVTILITDTGNLAATGTISGKLIASADEKISAADKTLLPFSNIVNLQPGKSMKLSLKLKLTSTMLPPNAAFLAAVLQFAGKKKDSNAADNSVFSDTQLTFK